MNNKEQKSLINYRSIRSQTTAGLILISLSFSSPKPISPINSIEITIPTQDIPTELIPETQAISLPSIEVNVATESLSPQLIETKPTKERWADLNIYSNLIPNSNLTSLKLSLSISQKLSGINEDKLMFYVLNRLVLETDAFSNEVSKSNAHGPAQITPGTSETIISNLIRTPEGKAAFLELFPTQTTNIDNPNDNLKLLPLIEIFNFTRISQFANNFTQQTQDDLQSASYYAGVFAVRHATQTYLNAHPKQKPDTITWEQIYNYQSKDKSPIKSITDSYVKLSRLFNKMNQALISEYANNKTCILTAQTYYKLRLLVKSGNSTELERKVRLIANQR